MLYRFDLLDDPCWLEAAVTDAADGDMIVLSTSVSDELPESINQWAGPILADRSDSSIAMLALFGSRDAWTAWTRDESQHHTLRRSLAMQARDDDVIAACV